MSMGGGGGGGATAKTTNLPPGWLQPYAGNYLWNINNTVQQDLKGGVPPGLLSQVANLNPLQIQGINSLGGLSPNAYNAVSPALMQALASAMGTTGQAQNLAKVGGQTLQGFAGGNINAPLNQTISDFASGKYAGPNPFLNQYYNQAAGQLSNQYELATQPALQAQFQQAGAFNSPGFNQAQGYAQYGLGQGLGTLGANIYEPAYEQGMSNMLNAGQMAQQNAQYNVGNRLAAAQGIPSAIAGMYSPANQLLGIGSGAGQSLMGLGSQVGQNEFGAGSAVQQQTQNYLNSLQSNAQLQSSWPFLLLQQLGGALGTAGMGGGQSISQTPGGGGGGLFGFLGL